MTPIRLFEKEKKTKKTDETSNVIHHFDFSEDKKITLMMQKSLKFTKTHASDMIHLDFKGLS